MRIAGSVAQARLKTWDDLVDESPGVVCYVGSDNLPKSEMSQGVVGSG